MQNTTDVTELVNNMFNAGAQKGFVRSRRHPSVAPYLQSTRSRKDIINLEKSVSLLTNAEEFAKSIGSTGKVILFVGTKPEAKDIVRKAAEKLDMPYVTERWIGGTLTNLDEIKKRIKYYLDLKHQQENNSLVYKTKKEKLMLEREIAKLERNFHGISSLEKLPDALFVIDIKHESIAVTEAKKLHIPVIGLGNTDCDISQVELPILANDTLITSIKFVVERLVKAIQPK